MKKITFFLTTITVFFFLVSCQNQPRYGLKNGDLLFVPASKKGISKAIDRVTQTPGKTHFSHVALVEKRGDSLFVLHAGTQNGSERITLDNFLNYERKGRSAIAVYRLKPKYQYAIPHALSTAKKWLGKPYNYSYILSDSALYCSDFIQRSFLRDSIFELQPMTFKNTRTHEIDSTWINFYQKQGIEVPEGKPGTNPNGLAHSNKIKFIKNISLK